MQREIKFRGKRIDSGDWIYGSLVGIDDTAVIVDHRDFCWNPLTDVNSFWFDMENNEVDPDTVGQYTGIKDARGADIYDGDIIECISSNHIPIRHLIRFCDERGYYAQYDNSNWTGELNECGPIYQHYIDECGKYVIGNIHDNPELIIYEKDNVQ